MSVVLHDLFRCWIEPIRSRPLIFLVLLVLGLGVFAAALALVSNKPQLDFFVHMTVLKGAQPGMVARLSLDDASAGVSSLPLRSSGRQIYGCGLQTLEANAISLAPANHQGVEIAIHGLEILFNGREVMRFTPAQLAQAKLEHLDILRLEPEALVVATRSPDALIVLSAQHLSPLPAKVLPLVRFIVADAMRPFVLSLLVASTLAILLCAGLQGADGPRLLLGTACGAVLVVTAVWGIRSQSFWPLPDVSAAVGLSAFVGSSKRADMLCIMVGGLLPLTMGLSGFLGARASGSGRMPEAAVLQPPPFRRAAVWHALILLCIVVGAFFLCVPDLGWEYAHIPDRQFTFQWDENNVLTFRYLVQMGGRPLMDFWYPYGGLIGYHLAFPWGSLFLQGHVYLQWVLLLFTCYYASDRRLWAACLILFIMFGFVEMSTLFYVARYTLPIGNVCLAFAGVDPARNRLQPAHILFWIAVLFATCFDPPVALYAGAPVGALLLARQATPESLGLTEFLQGLLRLLLVPGLCLAVLLGVLAATGYLHGVADFYLHLGELASYASRPVPILDWLRFNPVPEGQGFWLTGLLTGLGLFWLFASGKEERKLGGLVFMLGLGGGMMHFKQGVRPDIIWQIMPLLFLTVLVLLVFGLERMRCTQRGVAVATLAVLALLFTHAHGVSRIVGRAVYGYNTLPKSIAALRETWDRQREMAESYFALRKFSSLSEQMLVVNSLQTNDFGSPAKLFVLGDEPYLYIMSHRNPLFIINLYDSSPLRLQRKVAEVLLRDKPPVVWPGEPIGIDDIALSVRDPILFEAVIDNYIPAATIGRHTILRPRKEGEALPLEFWRKALGAVIDLGHLPRIVDVSRFPTVQSPGAKAAHFLKVRLDAPVVAAESKVIPVTVGGERYDILFTAVPGQEVYTIFLDRIWFYGPARKAGLHPAVEPSPGLRYDFLERWDDLSRLY